MKILFQTEELRKKLALLGAVVGKKAFVPVYAFVRLFSVVNDPQASPLTYRVGFVGVDIDATITTTFMKAQADGEIDVLLPFAKFNEIVGAVTLAETTIESADETKATLRAGKYKAELRTHPLSDWPALPERPEKATAIVALPALKEQISNVDPVVPKDGSKFVVTVAKVESTPEAFRLVGTDGFRLAVSTIAQNYGDWSMTIPKSALELINKLDGGLLSISEGEASFFFEAGLESLTINKTHGEFPNYQNIFPKNFNLSFTVKKKQLLEALKRLRPLANPEKPVVQFSVASDGAASLFLAANHSEADAGGATFNNVATDEVDVADAKGKGDFHLDVALLLPLIEKSYGSGDGDITVKTHIGAPVPVVDFRANGGSLRFLQMPVVPK